MTKEELAEVVKLVVLGWHTWDGHLPVQVEMRIIEGGSGYEETTFEFAGKTLGVDYCMIVAARKEGDVSPKEIGDACAKIHSPSQAVSQDF